MRNIENLTVEVTYSVGFGGVKVSNRVMKGLEKIQDRYGGKIRDNVGTACQDKDISEAFEWLSSNISEKDCYEWSYELIDCE